MIKLRTKDQRCVDIAREYALQCKFLKTMIENDSEEDYLELQVPLINSYIIPKVVEFLEHYKFDKMYEIPKVCFLVIFIVVEITYHSYSLLLQMIYTKWFSFGMPNLLKNWILTH